MSFYKCDNIIILLKQCLYLSIIKFFSLIIEYVFKNTIIRSIVNKNNYLTKQ